jgi:hypothetical protein
MISMSMASGTVLASVADLAGTSGAANTAIYLHANILLYATVLSYCNAHYRTAQYIVHYLYVSTTAVISVSSTTSRQY